MLRVFTKDVGKHFKKGQAKEFPKPVWSQIERSAKAPLHSFTKTIDLEPEKQK
jgi:hypothetical protein